jgi:hypothetical protein
MNNSVADWPVASAVISASKLSIPAQELVAPKFGGENAGTAELVSPRGKGRLELAREKYPRERQQPLSFGQFLLPLRGMSGYPCRGDEIISPQDPQS